MVDEQREPFNLQKFVVFQHAHISDSNMFSSPFMVRRGANVVGLITTFAGPGATVQPIC